MRLKSCLALAALLLTGLTGLTTRAQMEMSPVQTTLNLLNVCTPAYLQSYSQGKLLCRSSFQEEGVSR